MEEEKGAAAGAVPEYNGRAGRALTAQAVREMQTLELMLKLFCRKKHKCKEGLCEECRDLLAYARYRRSLCPFGDKKTFCSNCKIHCYLPQMHEKMRAVMRFSGPRMLFYSPKAALAHVAETVRTSRARKREEKVKKRAAKAAKGADK